jgi:hypothetical protein
VPKVDAKYLVQGLAGHPLWVVGFSSGEIPLVDSDALLWGVWLSQIVGFLFGGAWL